MTAPVVQSQHNTSVTDGRGTMDILGAEGAVDGAGKAVVRPRSEASCPLRWRPALSIGDGLMDRQHRGFFHAFERICAEIDQGATLGAVIAFAHRYVEALAGHCCDEEALMARQGYPSLRDHHAEHGALLGVARGVQFRLAGMDTPGAMRPLLTELAEAVASHLGSADMRYKTWVTAVQGAA